jgi:hypothetical protein
VSTCANCVCVCTPPHPAPLFLGLLQFPQLDIGLILLDRNFEEELGYLGRAYACDAPQAQCSLLGFPSECSLRMICDD